MAVYSVTIAPEAVAEVETIAAWWNNCRPAAPKLFSTELGQALDRLSARPEIGRRVARNKKRSRLHVITLRRTRYHVFYDRYDEKKELVVVRVRYAGRQPMQRPGRRPNEPPMSRDSGDQRQPTGNTGRPGGTGGAE